MVSRVGPATAYDVDGVRVPAAVGGRPALELCNTFAGWGQESGREYLTDYRALVVWARERLLIGAEAAAVLAGSRGRKTAQVLARTRRLRAALYGVLAGRPAETDDWPLVAAEAEAAAAAARLERRGQLAAWTLPVDVELPLRAAATAAADFLTAPEQLGRCPGHDCGWLFLNPRGTRRWCSMAVCGNRAKVARHARRAREHAERGRRTKR